MTYASYQDFRDEFGDDDLPDDAETRVVRAIDRASRLADTYIRSNGIAVPLVDPVAIADVRGSVLDIARYNAWPDTDNENLRKRYEDALACWKASPRARSTWSRRGRQRLAHGSLTFACSEPNHATDHN